MPILGCSVQELMDLAYKGIDAKPPTPIEDFHSLVNTLSKSSRVRLLDYVDYLLHLDKERKI